MATRMYCDVCGEEREVSRTFVSRLLPAASLAPYGTEADMQRLVFDACPGCWERVREAVKGLLDTPKAVSTGPPVPARQACGCAWDASDLCPKHAAMAQAALARTSLSPLNPCAYPDCIREPARGSAFCEKHIVARSQPCCEGPGCTRDALPTGRYCTFHEPTGRAAES